MEDGGVVVAHALSDVKHISQSQGSYLEIGKLQASLYRSLFHSSIQLHYRVGIMTDFRQIVRLFFCLFCSHLLRHLENGFKDIEHNDLKTK